MKFDIFIIIIGVLRSLGLTISMPLFLILFGGTLDNLDSNPVGLFDSIKDLCLKFLYVGFGMFVTGTLMIDNLKLIYQNLRRSLIKKALKAIFYLEG